MDHREAIKKSYRSRRLEACRAAEILDAIIDAIDGKTDNPYEEAGLPVPPSAAHKQELKNAVAHLLRTILIWNDGHVSPARLQRF